MFIIHTHTHTTQGSIAACQTRTFSNIILKHHSQTSSSNIILKHHSQTSFSNITRTFSNIHSQTSARHYAQTFPAHPVHRRNREFLFFFRAPRAQAQQRELRTIMLFQNISFFTPCTGAIESNFQRQKIFASAPD